MRAGFGMTAQRSAGHRGAREATRGAECRPGCRHPWHRSGGAAGAKAPLVRLPVEGMQANGVLPGMARRP